MKIKEFKYIKKNEIKYYKLLILNENNTHIAGIDLNKLNEEEQTKIIEIQKEYEEKLKPYMNSYRQYIKENVINED